MVWKYLHVARPNSALNSPSVSIRTTEPRMARSDSLHRFIPQPRHDGLALQHLLPGCRMRAGLLDVSGGPDRRTRGALGSNEEDEYDAHQHNCAEQDAPCDLAIRHAGDMDGYMDGRDDSVVAIAER